MYLIPDIIWFISLGMMVLYGLLIGSFVKGWLQLRPFRAQPASGNTMATVIVPARNEARHLSNLLDCLAAQSYEQFEVIIVNDHSEDETVEIASAYLGEHPNFKLIDSPGTGKKAAIESGINASAGSLAITTDADCTMGEKWLETIISFYETYQPKLVICPVALRKGEGVFEHMQQLEFLGMTGSTAGAAKQRDAIMCNGANLAYEKAVFQELGGFDGIRKSESGDDVFFMLKVKGKYPAGIRYLHSRDALVSTEPCYNVLDFAEQRKRWASKARLYKDKAVVITGFITFSIALLMLLNLCLSVFSARFVENLLLLYTFKCIIDGIMLTLVALFFRQTRLLWLVFPVQIMYVIYVPVISFMGLLGNHKWKGRTLRANG